MRPPRVDPKYAREVIQLTGNRRPEAKSDNTPPKVDPKYAKEVFCTRVSHENAPPLVHPQYSREFAGGQGTQTAKDRHSPMECAGKPFDVSKLTPFEFEAFVIEQLISDGLRAMYTQKTGDYGLDGVIIGKKHKIGIQVKKKHSAIGRPEIQKFVGALATSKLKYGVFITTSRYTEGAKQAARKLRVVLIDGSDLVRSGGSLSAFINPYW